jgi:hypothetical protein
MDYELAMQLKGSGFKQYGRGVHWAGGASQEVHYISSIIAFARLHQSLPP